MEPTFLNISTGSFWAFMLIAFGCGYLLASLFIKNKYKNELDKCLLEKSTLLNNVENVPGVLPSASPIKAVQTRGRSGLAVRVPEIKVSARVNLQGKLDFDRIGQADPEQANDLKMIDGIGPFIEEKLNHLGIYNFDQLSKLEDDDIKIITELLEFFPGRIKRDNWIDQAKKLSKKYRVAREV